ncbi:MAG TPA: alpha/beta fold hydrolase [Methylomirabilota bacterium]|nr:alpha/beta fold hydrolase [Methylomirabilota bacterium]
MCLRSLGDVLSGMLFLPESPKPSAAVIVCHGAGEFKENFFELCELLAARGVAALAIDMHGHGESAGDRFCVEMRQWVPDVQAAIDFLYNHPRVDGERIGAFGLSSGGTAIFETALIDRRLKTLVALDATVRNCLPIGLQVCMGFLLLAGRLTKWITRHDLRIPLNKFTAIHLASDPEVDRRLRTDPRARAAFTSFPFPGGAQAFFVDTLKRVSRIQVPTLILWGADDEIDPPETAQLLYDALSCEKQLHIILGNGHVGHLDRNKEQVFELTAAWALKTLAA